MLLDLDQKDSIQLRFKVGDAVLCNCGGWTPGTIARLWYVQSSFPAGKCAPYQIRLADGRLIYAPVDEDRVIRLNPNPDDPMSAPGAEEEEPERPESEKTPVTIVTGFLGAGKTTLVNYILKEDHGKKICVIENEFGAVSIDEGLVKENLSVAEEVISMDNGCACCTVRGDLVRVLMKLKDRRTDFDLIMLETTGLADPAPIVQTFTSNYAIHNHFRVDGVLCLVDSKYVLEHINDVKTEGTVNEAVQQVAFADRILINKLDLVNKAELREVKETIHSINCFAELVQCERSIVPVDKLMDLNAFSVERFRDALDEYDFGDEVCTDADCQDPTCETHHGHDHDEHGKCVEHEHGHGEGHGHGHGHGHEEEHGHGHKEEHGHGHKEEHGHGHKEEHGHGHGHEEGHGHGHADAVQCEPVKKAKKKTHDLSGVGSIALISEKPLVTQNFNRFMSQMLQVKARDLYRSKGILCFEGEGDSKFVFQGVHENIQYEESKVPWQEGEQRTSKVVLIGRALDREAIEADFKACVSGEQQRPARNLVSSFFGS